MPFLVDGHNLIGQMLDMSLADPNDEDKLIARLRSVSERTNKRIMVVFDPNPHDTEPQLGHGRSQYGLVTVFYASPGRKADDIIRALVGETKDKQGLIVVTSDAAVADFTKRCGVRVQSSQQFASWMQRSMTAQHEHDTKPVGTAKEVVNWSEVFKEPEPDAKSVKSKSAPKPPKGQKRSEQLKQQVKRIKPLV